MPVNALERRGKALPPLLVERRDAAAQPRDRLGQLGALVLQAGDARLGLGCLAFGHQINRADAVTLADQPIEPRRRPSRIRRHFVRGQSRKLRQRLRRRIEPLADLAGQRHQHLIRPVLQHFKSGALLSPLGQRLVGEPGIFRHLAQPRLA